MYRKLIDDIPLLEDALLPQTEDMSILMVACAMVQDYAGRPLRPDVIARLIMEAGPEAIDFEAIGRAFGLSGLAASEYYLGSVVHSDTAMYTTFEFAVLDAEGSLRPETHENLGYVDCKNRVVVLYDPQPGLRLFRCLGCRHWLFRLKEAA